MDRHQRGMRLHDGMTCMGWVAGDEANALAYWTMRLADELEGVARYAVAYRSLREAAWDGIRAYGTGSHAIHEGYPAKVRAILVRHEGRMASPYRQSLAEIARALAAVATTPALTGRVELAIAA